MGRFEPKGRGYGTLLCLMCVALWALIPVVAKLGQTDLDNHQFLFWSSLVSTLTMLIIVIVTGRFQHFVCLHYRVWLWLGCLGLLGTYVYYLFLYLGYAHANGMEVLVIQYTWPILIGLLSWLILKEAFRWQKLVAVMFGFLGVLWVLSKGQWQYIQVENVEVIMLVGAGAFCFALFSVLSKTVQHDPLVAVLVYFIAATLASLISMLHFSDFAWPSRATMVPVVLNGVLVNGISYVLWLYALRATQASYLAPLTFLTPIFSAIYLMVMFAEPFEIAYGVGLVLVVLAGLINCVSRTDG